MLTTHPFDDDKLREECGVFGIWGAETAAAVVALGLHALQHRGQEAAGITSFDGNGFQSHRAMGHVAGNFDKDNVIRALAGRAAIGHVRYSTTGETALRNVHPLFAELATGGSKGFFVRLDFSLRNRPRAGITASKNRAARVREENGYPRRVPAVDQNARASLFRAPDHGNDELIAW